MSAAKKTKSPTRKKTPAAKAVRKSPAKRAAAPAKAAPRTKAAPKRPALKPKPKGTHPSKKDVGIFGVLQKNIQDGLSVITETILPSPKKKGRR
jgi:hypothetical protein